MNNPPPKRSICAAAAAAAVAATLALAPQAGAGTPALASAEVAGSRAAPAVSYDGVVEAVRQTVIAVQVPGAVVALPVKAGDRVKAGQVLIRLDARAAELLAGAAAAQVKGAGAAQEAAAREFERQQQLYRQDYISRAALDRAESVHKSAQAEAAAQLASAGAARTQSGFYVVQAPYDGIVSDVSVVKGDMAMPGRPLLTMHDPSELRIRVAVPQAVGLRASHPGDAAPQIEWPGQTRIAPTRWQVMPTSDPATHTVELRLDLPAGTAAAPGMFARVWLAGGGDAGVRLSVPAQAVVRRAEMTGVYVVGNEGRPLLRLVRLGRASGEQVEVLTGLRAGERVALEPQAAARVR
jgi:membrane fusion protein, multidrug efflux system